MAYLIFIDDCPVIASDKPYVSIGLTERFGVERIGFELRSDTESYYAYLTDDEATQIHAALGVVLAERK